MDNERRFDSGDPYRTATVVQGRIFDDLKTRKWTKRPLPRGKSLFPDERLVVPPTTTR